MIKPIPGYGNTYGCDEDGNIYSYYVYGSKDGRLQETPHKLSQYFDSKKKYLLVNLTNNKNEHKNQLVHRLIALTWLPNPNNFNEINHKDKDITNNRAENLEWCNRVYNTNYSISDFGQLNGMRTHSKLYDENNNLLGEFDSLSAACQYCHEQYGVSISSLKKYKKSHGFYIVMNDNPNIDKLKQQQHKEWILYTPQDVEITSFSSVAEAGRYIKANIRDISVKLFVCHKKAYGYYVKEKCRD